MHAHTYTHTHQTKDFAVTEPVVRMSLFKSMLVCINGTNSGRSVIVTSALHNHTHTNACIHTVSVLAANTKMGVINVPQNACSQAGYSSSSTQVNDSLSRPVPSREEAGILQKLAQHNGRVPHNTPDVSYVQLLDFQSRFTAFQLSGEMWSVHHRVQSEGEWYQVEARATITVIRSTRSSRKLFSPLQ